MLLSMTGFGRGETVGPDGSKIAVQISSVNRKQLEIRFSMPSDLAALEVVGRKMVSEAISRGSVQVRCSISCSAESRNNSGVNTALLDELIRESRAARVRANLSSEVAVEALFAVPGVLELQAAEKDISVWEKSFSAALSSALCDFRNMRSTEGESLRIDLLERVQKLENWHRELAEMTSSYPEMAKKRIMERLAAEKLPVTSDDPALMREVLFYVDKGDVTEELTRLESHFRQFRAFLDSGEPVGRNMDFLAQEIFREITTLGNKAAVSGASPLVVAFKAEMEKIREQIQNIE